MLNLDNFIIVLDQTTHSGNLGSVARIVKNMGIKQVRLVNPHSNPLDEQAIAMSANATDVLESFSIFDTLENATADTNIILATSARKRAFSPRIIQPKQIITACLDNIFKSVSNTELGIDHNNLQINSDLISYLNQQKVAILFGTENSGLTNEALQMSNYHIVIDCNPDYTSLNLSMAVLVIAYELRKQITELTEKQQADVLIDFLHKVLTAKTLDHNLDDNVRSDLSKHNVSSHNETTQSSAITDPVKLEPLATHQQIEFFLERLEKHLIAIGFTQHPGTMQRLRLLTYRSQLNTKELAVLQGIITAQTQTIDKLKQKVN